MKKFKTPALKKLKDWAAANSLTAKGVAARLACDPSQVWRWLHGEACPSPVKRALIAQLTEGAVSEVDWLTAEELSEIEAGRARLGAA